MMNRRNILQGGAALLASGTVVGGASGTVVGGSSLASFAAEMVSLPFDNGERPLVRYPQKRTPISVKSWST